MNERQDYKAWFYVPVPKEPFEVKQQYIREVAGNQGTDPKYVK
jgi:hypothetical protein